MSMTMMMTMVRLNGAHLTGSMNTDVNDNDGDDDDDNVKVKWRSFNR